MSQLKTFVLSVLVGMAFLVTGLGGLQDILGIKLPMSKEHGWNDGVFLMLVAIFVQITMK
jgi:hypothetical protein